MRVEQLVGSYTNNQRGTWKDSCKNGASPHARVRKGSVMDIVCFSNEDADRDYAWLSAYVRVLPDDMVADKIKQIFHQTSSVWGREIEGLVEKLIFELF